MTNPPKITPQIRDVLKTFPEVTTVASELGRPDDGTDSTGFFNVEFYVGLKPYSNWTGTYRDKAALIQAMNAKLQAFPGIIFNYTQPAEDAVDEAETGLEKLAGGEDFRHRPQHPSGQGPAIKKIIAGVRGITDVTLVQELGQPSLTIKIDRAKIARYGLNVDDINNLITTAIGGDVATQVVQGEKQFDLVVRLEQQYRDNPGRDRQYPGGDLRRPADSAQGTGRHPGHQRRLLHLPRSQFALYRGAVLGGRPRPGRRGGRRHRPGEQQGDAAAGLSCRLGRRISEYTASRAQLYVILPLTTFLIFMLLFALYSNFKFPLITVAGVLLSAPVGGILALFLTGTPFSVSSGVGSWPCSGSRCRPRWSTSPMSMN